MGEEVEKICDFVEKKKGSQMGVKSEWERKLP